MADDILHHSNLRMRVTGNGNLDARLLGLYDDINTETPPSETLRTVAMESGTPRFVQYHANFEQQYTQVEVSVDEIDEYFYITKIVTYVKPVAVQYPM